ncbi:hypothetical protein Ana3638_01975 [Anaerocolumna sedimenticola]|uniref:Uncharacterized protein n=1 Tax=Anaerocolumna sedimenticola TaxID=2696063 RepID=A0A6P1TEY6_9FIRM|nr:hypothetical protein [Anaerocolumna sedimenticola]QHQ59714.1 hypothetical protein Ana3638_01975 [Anaerocolumna sedimenticola]
MMTFLVLRSRLRSLYQKYEIYIETVVKFIIAFAVFQVINSSIGYDPRIKQISIVLVLSLLSAFTPSAILVLLAALVSIGHVYYLSKILSVIVILIILIMYFLFIRFTPKLGYAVIAVPILYFLKIPYVVPIVLGLFATPISIVPTACGVILFYLFQVIQEAATMQINVSVEDTLQLYTYVVDNLLENKQLFMTIIIFSLIILVTYFIRRKKFDYAREIAVAAGTLTCILGFLFSDLRLDVSEQIGIMILGSLASAILALIIQFFRLTLDYTGVEHVQFEDEDYYYYVKAVPKINVTEPQINVKRFNTQKNVGLNQRLSGKLNNEVLTEEEDDYEEDYEEYKLGTSSKDDTK